MPINPLRKIIKKKIRKGSKAGSKTKFATMKTAKSFHGPTGKDRSIKYTSTPTTPVAKGRGMAKRMSKKPTPIGNIKYALHLSDRFVKEYNDQLDYRSRRTRAPMPARTGHGGAKGPKPSVKPRFEAKFERENR